MRKYGIHFIILVCTTSISIEFAPNFKFAKLTCEATSSSTQPNNRLVWTMAPIKLKQNFCSSKLRHLYYKSRSCHLRNTFPWFTQPWYLIVDFLCNWSRCVPILPTTGEKKYEFAFLYLKIFSNNEKFRRLENIFRNCDDITNQLRLQTKSKTHCSIWSPKYLPVKLSSIGILFICY